MSQTPRPAVPLWLCTLVVALLIPRPTWALEKGEFDPGPFDLLLKKYVAEGRVDYASWKSGGVPALDAILDSMAVYDLSSVMGKEPRAAFLMNAYHACAIRQILDHYPVKRARYIPGFFDKTTRKIAGEDRTLDGIEANLAALLPHRPEFALSLCKGSLGGPGMKEDAFRSDNLEAMLQGGIRETFDRGRVRYDAAANEMHYPTEVGRYMEAYQALPQGVLSVFSNYMRLGDVMSLNSKHPKIVIDESDETLNDIPPRRTESKAPGAP